MDNWTEMEMMVYGTFEYFYDWLRKNGFVITSQWCKDKEKADLSIQYNDKYLGTIWIRSNGVKVSPTRYQPHRSFADYYFSEWNNFNLFEEVKKYIEGLKCQNY